MGDGYAGRSFLSPSVHATRMVRLGLDVTNPIIVSRIPADAYTGSVI